MSDCCTSETSRSCTAAKAITGVIFAAGIAALVVVALTRHRRREVLDPLTEADRRIDALEESLRHLQDSFGQAVGV